MAKTFTFTAENGIEFTARLVFAGDQFGKANMLQHDEARPLVEFYDTRQPYTDHGQFVSRYYAGTLLQHDMRYGLNLEGGVPDWWIDRGSLARVLVWVAIEAEEWDLTPLSLVH